MKLNTYNLVSITILIRISPLLPALLIKEEVVVILKNNSSRYLLVEFSSAEE